MSTDAGAQGSFDVVATYYQLLSQDADLTMPVAAIEALIAGLAATPSTTVSETLDLVSKLTTRLQENIPNAISLSAGTDLFQRYLINNLQKSSGRSDGGAADFEQIRSHLVQSGRLIVSRAKAARESIAAYGPQIVRDGKTVLTNGGSRVVSALLKRAADGDDGSGRGSIRFRVIYVTSPSSSSHESESAATVAALRARGIPVATIPPAAIAYSMHLVSACIVGAEGVVENGGIINRLGTYQIGLLAKAKRKPFYVVAESHKFVRLYPLGQEDLGIEQNIVDFQSTDDTGKETQSIKDEAIDMGSSSTPSSQSKIKFNMEDAVDYTPPELISCIITETGVTSSGAVSEELIKIWS